MNKITLALFSCFFWSALSAQFSEDFETGWMPAGWSVIQGGDPLHSWKVNEINNYLGVPAHSGSYAAIILYDEDLPHDDYLVTPPITVTAGVNDSFSFWVRTVDLIFPEMIDVLLSTTGTDAGDFTVTLESGLAPQAGDDYYLYSYDLTPYVGQTVYVAFYTSTTNGFIFEIDDVVSTALPDCPVPSSINASDIDDSSALLTWPSSGTNFEIEYGPDGFTQGTGTLFTATGNSTTISGLDQDTPYDVYIRQDCGGGLFSDYLPFSFQTMETPVTNDECATAAELIPGVDFESSAQEWTSNGATTAGSPNYPNCQPLTIRNVWFSVVVPFDGNVTIETGPVPGSPNDDTIIVARPGNCASTVAQWGCNDDNEDGDDKFSKLVLTGMPAGETIHIEVWQYYPFPVELPPGPFRIAAYNAALSVAEEHQDAFKYYPNPVKDILSLSYDKDITNVTVMNMVGQQVLAETINASAAELDVSSLSQGTYVVKVYTADAVKVVKVVKQ